MKKTAILFAVFFAVGLMVAGISHGQPAQSAASNWNIGIPAPGEGEGVSATPAIETVTGTVMRIEPIKGVQGGLQMRVKTDKGDTVVAYLGPKWFITNQKLKFEKGDTVEVRGAKIISKGQYRMIATEVSKGDWTMKLRNEDDGMPNWICCFPRQQMKEE